MGRVVFHIDFDYFYAQCEEVRKPDLKSKPVCVCVFSDRGGDSGAIATANYTARKFGVKSGIPITFAKKKLEHRKDAVFLPVDFQYYEKITEKAITECFYDSGEFTTLEIETAINKSRYKNHSFGDYDKFIMTQIMTKENLGNNNSQDNWLKTSEGRKAVSIAKLYFDDECLIDEANVSPANSG